MANQYQSSKSTIGALLSLTSPAVIRVPDWQRSYSWTEKEVEIFWQDIVSFSDRYSGNNVDDQEYFLGSVVLVNRTGQFDLLDGQQRLATSTILLSVIRDFVRRNSENAATRTQQKWICELDDATGNQSYQLTLNIYDRDFFRQTIQTSPAGAKPSPSHDSHRLILSAQSFFVRKFEERSASLSNDRRFFDWCLRIRRVVTDHVSVVCVSSADEDNAASVFETLNDRGIGLSTPDLLRNLLLRLSSSNDRDEIIKCWEVVLLLEKRVDQFIRHFWLSRHGDVKTRALYREMKEHITKEELSPLTFSRDLRRESELYADMTAAIDDHPELKRLLEEIKLLGANSLYPPILSAYEKYSDEQKICVIQSLLTLFVRHNVIGALENSTLETNLFSLAKQIRGGLSAPDAVAFMKSKSPSDLDFDNKFETSSQPRQNTARYLLRKIEDRLARTEEKDVALPDKVHVEHIYPQEPEKENRWKNHEAYVSRIGNLTLLAKKLNISARNSKFADKLEYYEKSQILMTKELLASTEWNETKISARQKLFASMASSIWSFPECKETPVSTNTKSSEAKDSTVGHIASEGAGNVKQPIAVAAKNSNLRDNDSGRRS